MHAGTTSSVIETVSARAQNLEKLLSSAAVLLVDEQPAAKQHLQSALSSRCALFEVAGSAEEAEALRLRLHFDLILVSTQLPGLSGLEWVRQLRDRGVQTHVIYLSAKADTELALEALRNGADDFLLNPCTADQLLESIYRSLSRQNVVTENSLLRLQMQNLHNSFDVVGESDGIKNILALAHRVAATQSTVLLQGETGTGKELIAQTIHSNSQRSGELVAINCGSISSELFESELFGHVKGAFTGATHSRDGLFLHANKGTVFLDEISELPAPMQTKLLRVLEERVIRPVGSEREIPVNVRILAATNQDLNALAERGDFRKDLYYRLNVFNIDIPPLRHRCQDIELLVAHFMQQLCVEMRVAPLTLMHTDWQRLKAYPWPGNVRELRNVIERTLLLGRLPVDCLRAESTPVHNDLSSASLSDEISNGVRDGAGFPVDWALADVERSHIESVLKSVKHNKSAAARILGVSRKTLERKAHLWYPDSSG